MDDISFWKMLRVTKVGTLTWKYPIFYISICLAVISYYYFSKMDAQSYADIFPYISDTIASISATLMGIILAGLAIIVGLAVGDILNLLLRGKTLQKLLFPFWLVTLLWAISTIIAISLNFVPLFVSKSVELYLLSFEVFIFTYSVFGTVGLIGSTIKIFVLIAQLVPKE
ncbi:hypothetical protein [Niallia taxi]|uniref:Uncharacterized protein n=1 Tax=Niallia taxi TaxID=2499688 RepID=A0A437KHV6_9BACI|nr:hypothetical protein [Niallia taxi]RVT67645.1 hypothetical protein EM808_03995 [Niallia taxi]